MKVIRFIFEALLPGIISVGIAIQFQWSWPIMLILYIALSGIGHFIILRIKSKEAIKEATVIKYMIYSITLMLLGIIGIVVGFIGGDKQITLIIGIALFSVGASLIFAKCINYFANIILMKINRN